MFLSTNWSSSELYWNAASIFKIIQKLSDHHITLQYQWIKAHYFDHFDEIILIVLILYIFREVEDKLDVSDVPIPADNTFRDREMTVRKAFYDISGEVRNDRHIRRIWI